MEDSQRGSTGDFCDDPEKDPIKLPSGKLELYSKRLADNFPDDNERGPYPKYVIGGPGWTHDESLDIENGAEKCKTYPLILQSNHPRWRVHVQHDDIPWLREIPTCKVKGYDGYMYEPVWIHPKDAEARGIKPGDIVKVYNDRGIELGGAYLSERIIPGAIHMDHGARVDMINCDPADYSERGDKWINRGGTNNNISPYPPLSKNCPGMVVSSFLVEVAKVTGDEMQEWMEKYPEAFVRAYDPAYGLLFDAWVEGGMEK
jgi:trimethylamine-N-oxide reductase (cytochrome c)